MRAVVPVLVLFQGFQLFHDFNDNTLCFTISTVEKVIGEYDTKDVLSTIRINVKYDLHERILEIQQALARARPGISQHHFPNSEFPEKD